MATVDETFYIIGTVAGPHPIRRWSGTSTGDRSRGTRTDGEAEDRLPDTLVACIGGGSNAMGLSIHSWTTSVRMFGVEAGVWIETGEHAASLTGGRPGVLHGNRTYLLQNDDGQITEAHSISAGLDYPDRPEHAWLHEVERSNTSPPRMKTP